MNIVLKDGVLKYTYEPQGIGHDSEVLVVALRSVQPHKPEILLLNPDGKVVVPIKSIVVKPHGVQVTGHDASGRRFQSTLHSVRLDTGLIVGVHPATQLKVVYSRGAAHILDDRGQWATSFQTTNNHYSLIKNENGKATHFVPKGFRIGLEGSIKLQGSIYQGGKLCAQVSETSTVVAINFGSGPEGRTVTPQALPGQIKFAMSCEGYLISTEPAGGILIVNERPVHPDFHAVNACVRRHTIT